MSRIGQRAIYVLSTGPMVVPQLEWHDHPVHQLTWASRGVLFAATADGTWTLPPDRALWIPAGVRHTMGSEGAAANCFLYLLPEHCPVDLAEPTVIAVSGLLRELAMHLADETLGLPARLRAESVVYDQLRPLPRAALLVVSPVDPRARRVAEALRDNPADDRGLEAWGRLAGASARTLARVFVAETGLSFGRWRTRLRLQAAMPLLATGTPVGVVAHRVGYHTASAFVAAFRRSMGMPPTAYWGSG